MGRRAVHAGFRTRCGCCITHQLTVDMAVCTRHAQDQASQEFNMNGQGGGSAGGGAGAQEAPLLMQDLFIVDGC